MSESFFTKSMKIAVPVAMQALLQSSFSIVDQVMVGRLGRTAIAAVEIGCKPGFIFTFVSGAVATVTGIMISQYMGKEENEKIDSSMSVNLCVMLAIAVLTAMLCLIIPGNLMGVFTEDTEVITAAQNYVRITAVIYPLSGIATLLAVQIRCEDHSEYPLYISAIAAVMNTVLNYTLIFGHCGFPQLGIIGAALGSLVSQVVNLALMVVFYTRICRFRFVLKMNKLELKQYATMLIPIVMNEFLWTIGQNINTLIYGHMGTDELAGMALTGPIQGLIIGALSGLSQAAGILIGKRLGEKNYDDAYRESKSLCIYGFIGAAVLSAALIISRSFYVTIFNIGPEVREIGANLLVTFAVLAPVKVQNMILGGGIIRSGGKTKYIMVIDMIGTWCVGVPLGLLTGLYLKLPIVWVYFILSQEELLRYIITLCMFKSRKWMNTIE